MIAEESTWIIASSIIFRDRHCLSSRQQHYTILDASRDVAVANAKRNWYYIVIKHSPCHHHARTNQRMNSHVFLEGTVLTGCLALFYFSSYVLTYLSPRGEYSSYHGDPFYYLYYRPSVKTRPSRRKHVLSNVSATFGNREKIRSLF